MRVLPNQVQPNDAMANEDRYSGIIGYTIESTTTEIRGWQDWIALTTGQAQATSDRSLEDIVASALRTGFN
jgi:hypothetical protein